MTTIGGAEEPDRISLTVNGGDHILILEGQVLHSPRPASSRPEKLPARETPG